MEIKKNSIDDLTLGLTLTVTKDDYAGKKKKRLSDYRKQAEIKGFRKGMVPASLIEKMYGQHALVDAVNDVISESLNSYITENSLRILGEPLPAEDQPKTDWVDGNDFTFKFECGVNPEIDIELTKEDTVPFYTINVTEAAKKEMKDNLLRQYGALAEGEKVGADDFIVADFVQGETRVEGTYVSVRNISDEVRPSVIGLKSGDSVDVDVNVAFPNETDRASMLKVKKEELADMDPMYRMTVVNVKTFKPAELNQETFDRIFGDGTVKSEEEFDAKIAERLVAEYAQESEYRLSKDLKEYLVKKADVALPEKFLKRWLFVANDGKFTMEDIEKEFDLFLVDYRWQLVKGYLAEKYSVKVEKEDLLASAKSLAAYQFAMYGMNNVPDAQLESFAKNILAQENESRRVYEQVEDQKTIAAVRSQITLKNKKISVEKFRELK